MPGAVRRGAAALHSVRYNERSRPEVLERRSPTGIARQRETRTNNPTPRQFHAYKPTHHQPRRITPTWSAGQFSRWGPPTGIARERETRPNDPTPRQSHACKPTHPQPHRITWSMERRSPTGIARERETRTACSEPSAKPAPTTLRTARSPNRAGARNPHQHGSNGAPVSDRHRAGARNPHRRRCAPPISRLGAPVSDRHRAGARNLHRRRWPRQSHGLERRSPTGIARERETRTDDAAPRQSHGLERRSPTGTAARSAAKTA